MTSPKIPGVYVQEIPTLPPGVAEVNSAIPAFIGYTSTTTFNEVELKNKPVKIQSMLEFTRMFGGSSPVSITNVTANLTDTQNNATVNNQFYLYDSLQLYFLNGGGPCYIVATGSFSDPINKNAFVSALDALDFYDEPTLYLFPDSVKLSSDDLAAVQQLALAKCQSLMDRFCIFDLQNTGGLQKTDDFRNKVGMASLKYGAAYTPWLITSFDKNIQAEQLGGIFTILSGQDTSILNQDTGGGVMLSAKINEYKSLLDNLALLKATPSVSIYSALEAGIDTYSGGAKKTKNPFDAAEIAKPIFDFATASAVFSDTYDSKIESAINTWKAEYDLLDGATDEEKAQNKTIFLSKLLNDPDFEMFKDVHAAMVNAMKSNVNAYETLFTEKIPYYASLLKILAGKLTILPPSGAMAGLYCKNDNERGVWKAPANISVSSVSGVSQLFTQSDLADLNVDPVAGKSINVIRPITGYGVMVMGARTLAGNDSEWRYIPVRRLFIFIEENLKKSTAWAVFEPNDRLLWLKIRTQIENYLFELWRRGALAGAKPEHAYQVSCGLNSTMTPQDVLEGKLNVQIMLAAVRPAEFIVLKFSHQLQKS